MDRALHPSLSKHVKCPASECRGGIGRSFLCVKQEEPAMDFLKHWLLTILIFLPMAGSVLVLFMRTRDGVRWATLGTTLATFLLSLLLLVTYKWNEGKGYAYEENGGVVQMVQHARWIPAF